MGADAEAWRRGPEVGRGTRAGERERGSSPATFPNEFEELYKNSNEEKIYTKHLECDENVIISFSRRFKTSTSDNCALTPLRRQNFLRIVFEKIICLLDRSWNHIHSLWKLLLKGKALIFIHVAAPRGSRTFETFCFLLARRAAWGQGAKCPQRSKITSLVTKTCKASNALSP